MLTIADEVMTGMGRTGRSLAVQHWGVVPDIVVLAKGLSSGYAPLGAIVASKRIVDAITNGSGSLVHGFTYNAHPSAAAAGAAVLKIVRDRKLVEAADSSGSGPAAHLKPALERLRTSPSVGDVRGIGLLWGIEFVKDRETKEPFASELGFSGRVTQAALERGVVVYPMQGCVNGYRGDHIVIAPPAVITDNEIDSAIEQVAAAVRDAEAAVVF